MATEKEGLIRKCTCTHPPQDAIHGAGMRVHNPTRKHKEKNAIIWRCTVCEKLTQPIPI